jgi:glyoxylase-like metal-dependent hydrolase (beta-lactamase superfamily II)
MPADIHLVVHTHLHADHVGWDTHLADGAWQPTFPNARHVYVGEELEYWRAKEQREHEDVYGDSVEPILDAGLGELVDANCDLGHGLRLFPTLGHTPGHASLEIVSNGAHIVVTGDLIHHPVQMAHPSWTEIADYDGALGIETRAAFLDEHATAGTLIAGTHFPTDPVGRVVADGNVWRFEPVIATP